MVSKALRRAFDAARSIVAETGGKLREIHLADFDRRLGAAVDIQFAQDSETCALTVVSATLSS